MRVFYSILLFFAVALGFAQDAFIRTYGLDGSFNEGKGIAAFSDSTYIMLGNRQTFGGQSAAWLFRVDSNGTILWEKYFDSYVISMAENLSQHDDTSVIITGTVLAGNDYSMLVARVGLSGSVIWEKIIGTQSWDQALCSASDADGNIYLSGYGQAIDTMDQDILLYKLDGNTGDSLFSKRLDAGYNDKGVYLDTMSGNNLLLISHSYKPSSDSVMSRVWKMNVDFDTLWTWMPCDSAEFEINCIFEDTFHRIVFSGKMLPDTGQVFRFWYGFLNDSGIFGWQLIHPPYFLKNIRRGILDSNNVSYYTGGFFPAYFGFGNSDIGFWRDSLGWGFSHNYGALQDEEGMDLDFAADGGMVFIGTTKNYGEGVNNIFFVKVGPDYLYNDSDYAHYTPVSPSENMPAAIYPNPSSGTFCITLPNIQECKIDIYNLQGVLIKTDRYNSGETYTLKGFENGVYLIKITSGHQSYNFRLLLQND